MFICCQIWILGITLSGLVVSFNKLYISYMMEYGSDRVRVGCSNVQQGRMLSEESISTMEQSGLADDNTIKLLVENNRHAIFWLHMARHM